MIKRVKEKFNYLQVKNFSKKTVKSQLKRPIVSFCFDDFAKSSWINGGAILEKYNALGSFYFSSYFCGKTIDNIIYYDEQDLREIKQAGHELGCHTANHFPLPTSDATNMRHELSTNRQFFQSIFPGEKLSTFAYPYGSVNLMVKRIAMQEFAASRGVWPGINTNNIDLGLLKTVCLEPHVLEKQPVRSWAKNAIAENGWLIFTTHDIDINHTKYGMHLRHFEDVVKKISAMGIEILPVKNAIGLVTHGE